jgi:uncharacterized membrane protein
MEDILVVVFDSERTAYEGLNYLNQLDCDGVIDLYAGSVIEKEADGRVTEKGRQGNFAFHTIAGSAVGGLAGSCGGPAGLGIGATVGGLTGMIRDLHAAGVNSRFVSEVAAILKPGKFAIVGDVNEEYLTPIETRMQALGGTLFRTEKQNFEDEVRMYQIAQIEAQINQLKGEELVAMSSDRKQKIQAQIKNLNQKLQEAKSEAEQRTQELQRETEAKVQVLQQKAAKAEGEAKTRINAEIDQVRQQYENSVGRLKNAKLENSKEQTSKAQKAS